MLFLLRNAPPPVAGFRSHFPNVIGRMGSGATDAGQFDSTCSLGAADVFTSIEAGQSTSAVSSGAQDSLAISGEGGQSVSAGIISASDTATFSDTGTSSSSVTLDAADLLVISDAGGVTVVVSTGSIDTFDGVDAAGLVAASLIGVSELLVMTSEVGGFVAASILTSNDSASLSDAGGSFADAGGTISISSLGAIDICVVPEAGEAGSAASTGAADVAGWIDAGYADSSLSLSASESLSMSAEGSFSTQGQAGAIDIGGWAADIATWVDAAQADSAGSLNVADTLDGIENGLLSSAGILSGDEQLTTNDAADGQFTGLVGVSGADVFFGVDAGESVSSSLLSIADALAVEEAGVSAQTAGVMDSSGSLGVSEALGQIEQGSTDSAASLSATDLSAVDESGLDVSSAIVSVSALGIYDEVQLAGEETGQFTLDSSFGGLDTFSGLDEGQATVVCALGVFDALAISEAGSLSGLFLSTASHGLSDIAGLIDAGNVISAGSFSCTSEFGGVTSTGGQMTLAGSLGGLDLYTSTLPVIPPAPIGEPGYIAFSHRGMITITLLDAGRIAIVPNVTNTVNRIVRDVGLVAITPASEEITL